MKEKMAAACVRLVVSAESRDWFCGILVTSEITRRTATEFPA
jgi:hypothetical protein